MRNYTDAELEELLTDVESDRVERKESFGEVAKTARESICAFANDLPNHNEVGVLFIGAKDDGKPSGLPITDELLRTLSDIKTDGNIVPPPSLVVQKRILGGQPIAVVFVEPAVSPPVRHKGTIWVRTGPRKSIATAQEEQILNEKRRFKDQPFDVRPASMAKISDLDRAYFMETYLPAAVAPEVLEANERTYEQRLSATKMTTGDAATVLGVLTLSAKPNEFVAGAYIQFLRFQGWERSDPVIDSLEINSPFPAAIRRLEEKMVAHNRVSVDFTSESIERRSSDYPAAALEQLVRNAVMHRTYEVSNAPIRVDWFDDRIEIRSPGGAYGAVTPENFGEPGVTDYRNPNLAEAMRNLGLVQRFGAGIQTARRLLAQNGNPPPGFLVESTFVSATLWKRPTEIEDQK